MNEDPSRYFKIAYHEDGDKKVNGVGFVKDRTETEFKVNQWITGSHDILIQQTPFI
jgi:hypothetical protein